MTAQTTPSLYVRTDGRQVDDEPYTERMARWESARDQGAAYVALHALRFGIWLAQDTLTDDEVRVAVDDALNAKRPRCIFDDEPTVPGWARGMLEDDTRFRPVSPAAPADVEIAAHLVGLVREGVMGELSASANAIDTADFHAGTDVRYHAARIRHLMEIVDLLDANRGEDSAQLRLSGDHTECLRAAIDYVAGGAEDDARSPDTPAGIIEHARTAEQLRALRETIPA